MATRSRGRRPQHAAAHVNSPSGCCHCSARTSRRYPLAISQAPTATGIDQSTMQARKVDVRWKGNARKQR
eukprot:5303893-Alexandrium_andersonii.AAC.1